MVTSATAAGYDSSLLGLSARAGTQAGRWHMARGRKVQSSAVHPRRPGDSINLQSERLHELRRGSRGSGAATTGREEAREPTVGEGPCGLQQATRLGGPSALPRQGCQSRGLASLLCWAGG